MDSKKEDDLDMGSYQQKYIKYKKKYINLICNNELKKWNDNKTNDNKWNDNKTNDNKTNDNKWNNRENDYQKIDNKSI